MTKTTNYNLPQWEVTDALKRSDFNAAMKSIDTALTAANSTAASAVSAVNNLFELGTIDMTGFVGGDTVTSFSFTPKVLLLWAKEMNAAVTMGNLQYAKIQKVGGSGYCSVYLIDNQLKISGVSSGPSEIFYMAFR